MTRTNLFHAAFLSLLLLTALARGAVAQTLFTVSVNTAGIQGNTGGLAFDVISGDNVIGNNTFTVNNFTGGTLAPGVNANQGDAVGNLPGLVTLKDSGFTESFRGDTFGNALSFTLSSTNNFIGPGVPDEFSFFLTNAANTGTLVHTDDPTGADALFALDLSGAGRPELTVFNPLTAGVSYSVTAAQQAVPEPSSLALLAVGLIVGSILLQERGRKR